MTKNHDKALTELAEFRWAFGGLLLLSVILFGVIGYNSDLKWQFDYEGFNFFVKAFSVPFAVLTSIIPIVGFIALNHRSVQTKEQIELARSQNSFTNYYKHIEEFEKYVSDLYDPLNSINARKVHFELFPNAKSGDYTPIDPGHFDFTVSITNIANSAISYIEEGEHQDYIAFVNNCSDLQCQIYHSCSDMGEDISNSAFVITSTEGTPEEHVFNGLRSLYRTINGFHKLRAFESPQVQCVTESLLHKLVLRNKTPIDKSSSEEILVTLKEIVNHSNLRF
ncbi:hypothetical protein [Vibrio splendidus]|uniref:hypothetical protein n=1 Tax=Vibrio splendidus TaxID=29497 RepID=UPI000E099C94|nr:hypothetical protein [Vibrio splendidus]